MPRRGDTVPRPANAATIPAIVSRETREKFRRLAAEHGLSMSSYLRLVVEQLTTNPPGTPIKIPKNRN